MNLRTTMDILDVPAPVLFNAWKHHGRAVRSRIDAVTGPEDLQRLSGELVVVGHALMDFYTGELLPAEIAQIVVGQLDARGVLEPEAFRAWVVANGGFRLIEADADGSLWTVRFAHEPGRHVHLHPGRHTPRTQRVRAHALKTAILAMAHALVHGGEAHSVEVVNEVRRRFLDLHTLPSIDPSEGIGLMVETLKRLGG